MPEPLSPSNCICLSTSVVPHLGAQPRRSQVLSSILVYPCHHDRSQPRCGNSEFNGRQAFASWTRAARFSDLADRLAGLCARPPWFTLSFIHLYNSSLAREQLAAHSEPLRVDTALKVSAVRCCTSNFHKTPWAPICQTQLRARSRDDTGP